MKPKTTTFQIKDTDTAEVLAERLKNLALKMFLDLDAGEYQLEVFKTSSKRSSKLNRTIHAIFTDIANTMAEHGLEQLLTIKARPTAENIKTFFKENILGGKKTSECTNKELSEGVEVLLESFNDFFKSRGIDTVHINSQELNDLLK